VTSLDYKAKKNALGVVETVISLLRVMQKDILKDII